MTRQDRFLWSAWAAPSHAHKEPARLQTHCANMPKPCLEVGTSSATVMGTQDCGGGSVVSLLLCRLQEILEQHLGITSPFYSYCYQRQQQKHHCPFVYCLPWARHYGRCLVLHVNSTAPRNSAPRPILILREKQCLAQSPAVREVT